MTPQELDDLINDLRAAGTDTATVEVKAFAQHLPKNLNETLSAFANTSGGTIILGLDENTGFAPVANFDPKRISDALERMCTQDMHPPVRADISIVPHAGANVVTAHIGEFPQRDQPCYVRSKGKYGGSFARIGDGDHKLSNYEVDRLVENSTQPRWDREIVTEASYDDIDDKLVRGLLDQERAQKPRVFGKKNDLEALISLHVLDRAEDGELYPTLGGLLAVGTHPQEFFPKLTVSFAMYPGSDKTSTPSGQRFRDSATLAGPIPDLIEQTVERVVSNMRIGGMVQGAFRRDLPDYPPVAVREAVANALMHRDYSPQSRGSQVQVNMYVDRLEIINPGGLYGPVTVETLTSGKGLAAARNQYLSNILESVPYPDGGFVVENRGSGYQEIQRQLEHELLPPPRPKNSIGSFSLTFSRRAMTHAEKGAAVGESSRDRIMNYLRVHETATSRELAAAAGISRGSTLKIVSALRSEGLVERTEPARSRNQRYRLMRS